MKRVFESAWMIAAGLGLVLVAINVSISVKEALVAQGRVVLLELAPADPRSLMQGDYMRLDSALARKLPEIKAMGGATSMVHLKLDARGVATTIAPAGGTALANDEVSMVARKRAGFGWRLGSDAFFFQEGNAEVYNGARYGEYRVAANGESVLVGLRDAQLQRLGADRYIERWQVPERARPVR